MSAAQQQASAVVPQQPQSPSLLAKFSSKYSVEPNRMLESLKATAFYNSSQAVSNEQLIALLVVADQYGLNPFTREIYAFPDKNKGGIVPIVSIDGWSRIVNEQSQFDGVEFRDGPAGDKHKGAPEWIDCVLHRKDRSHPTVVRERLAECYRDSGPWNSHPSRMLRHKAFMQCARIAFSLVGIYDEDEAQRIIEGNATVIPETPNAIAAINAQVTNKPAADQPSTSTAETKPAAGESKPAKRESKSAGPTAAEVGDRILKATTLDELQEARSLIGFDEKTDAELRAEADRMSAKLGTKPLL